MSNKEYIERGEMLAALTTGFFPQDVVYTEAVSIAKQILEAAPAADVSPKSEVIDEFAKRLKEKMNGLSRMEYNCVPYFLVSKSFIDKIAAEMKGGE
jgi:hypothetical protein